MVKNFIQSLSFGILAIIGAFIVQAFTITIISVLTRDSSINSIFEIDNVFLAIVIIAVIEEIFRILLIKKLLEINNSLNVLFKGFSFGFGFSLVELFFISKNVQLNPSIFSLMSVFVFHVLLSMFILYKLNKHSDAIQIIISLVIAILTHILYNLFVINLT